MLLKAESITAPWDVPGRAFVSAALYLQRIQEFGSPGSSARQRRIRTILGRRYEPLRAHLPPASVRSDAAQHHDRRAGGHTYALNQAVPASYSCADESGGSGVASCAGPVASGSPIDTASVGSKTFTVQASDNAGNAASKS